MGSMTKQDAIVHVRVATHTQLAQDLANGTNPNSIDDDLTFTDDAPNGYGRTAQRYLHLCTVIAQDLRTSCHRELYFTVAFVNDHQSKPISDFIFDTADLLVKAKEDPQVSAAQQ